MGRFKLIELIELQNKTSYVYYFGNNIKNLGKYIRWSENFSSPFYLVIEKPVYDYFLENKNKYLFIKENVYFYIVDKKYALSNVNLFYKNSMRKFYKFIKYHSVKEKLYGKISN